MPESSCGVACADMIEEVYNNESTGQVAAVVVEPIQAAGGIIVPPPEFLPKIEDFCKRKGILFFVDEIKFDIRLPATLVICVTTFYRSRQVPIMLLSPIDCIVIIFFLIIGTWESTIAKRING